MSEVRIRKLEPWVVDMLRDQAKLAGCSLEAFLRQRLQEEAMRTRRKWAKRLRAGREAMFKKYGMMSDSTPGIREDRETRG